MKNKKGFTLVELLAVIAILAILVIIALPNVLKLFRSAKENTFANEVQNLVRSAEDKYLTSSLSNGNNTCFDSKTNPLDMTGRDNINYLIKLTNKGKVIEVKVIDDSYQLLIDNQNGINKADIGNKYKIETRNKTTDILDCNNSFLVQGEEGTGDEDTPYKIQYIEDLVELSNNVNDGNNYEGKYFVLTRDLDFKSPSSYKNSESTDYGDINGINGSETLIKELTTGSGFTPIGLDINNDDSICFSGIFDGNNHKINNILIQKDNKFAPDIHLYYGFFGEIKNSIIKNLTLYGRIEIPDMGSDIVNRGSAGGIVGMAYENNTLTNLHNYADVYTSSSRDKVAGILGDVHPDGSVTITNCDNHGNIDNSNSTGGIVGVNYGTLTITNCNNYGNITNKMGATGMGGIIATIETQSINTEITNCNNYGTISVEDSTATEQKAGGIAGNVKTPLIIKNCNNSGNIINNINKSSFKLNAGGIVGRVASSTSIINSHNSGNIIGARRGGGVVGHKNTSGTLYLDNTSSLGEVNCFQFVDDDGCGGVLGFASPGIVYILNSYNTGTITSPGPASGIFGNYASNSSAMIFNSYNIGQVNGTTTSNGIFQNSGPITVNNVYNAGELLGTTKYGIGNILATSSVSISNSYFDDRVSLASNKDGIGTIKTLNDIKNASFVNLLNENKNSINLTEIDSNLSGYTLCNWKLGTSLYPELDCK